MGEAMSFGLRARALISFTFLIALLAPHFTSAQDFSPAGTSRASFGTFPGAIEANADSQNVQMSKNGRFIVFESKASNLVNYVAVTPGITHIYLFDRQANSLELISINKNGSSDSTGNSTNPSVSADGRYVAFSSVAPALDFVNVCFEDTCHVNKVYAGQHIYVRDRLANRTFLASQVTLASQIQDSNADGSPKTTDVCADGTTTCNLLDPAQIKRMPVLLTVNKRISAAITPNNGPGPVSDNSQITADGRFIAFDTDADNLAGMFAPFVFTGPTDGVDYCSCVDVPTCGPCANPGVVNGFNTPTGIFPAIFSRADTNGVRDAYVRDGANFTSKRLSMGCQFHSPNGCDVQGTQDSILPEISDDGLLVTFQTKTPFLDLDFNNAEDIFLVELGSINGEVKNLRRITNNTSRIVAPNGASTNASISADGRYIAYQSTATNLLTPGTDTNGLQDVFVYDSKFFVTVRCGTSSAPEGNGNSSFPNLSGSGEFIAFNSNATNWGPSSGFNNVYVGNLIKDTIGRLVSCQVSLGSVGNAALGGDNDSTKPNVATVPLTVVNPDTTTSRTQVSSITYQSLATNLNGDVPDTNGFSDIFQAPVCSALDAVTDTDGDGTVDCFDQCRNDILKVVDVDTDADGFADCEDGCPTDPQKSAAGVCGCGTADIDTDSDGTPDCIDGCKNDPLKTAPGACGCGFSDIDANNNGTPDCKDSTNPTPTPGPATPTPIVTATPVFTATPSPTATPDLSTQIPGIAQMRRVEPKISEIFLNNSFNFAPVLDHYTIQLVIYDTRGKKKGTKTYRTKDNFKILKNLAKGRYKARYQVNLLGGAVTPFSAYSKTFIVR
jgi:Tol biopolymer transport system component